MSRKTIIIVALIVIAVGAGAIILFYSYQGMHYVSTDDARIAADVVPVTPEIPGNLMEWQVSEGDLVQAGQILGRQDLGTNLTSGQMNPGTIGSIGGVMADKALIKAPISGEVIKSNAVPGQMAAPGTTLAIIGDVSHLYVSANIKEGSIARVHEGQAVDITVDAFPGKRFQGTVESVGLATASTFSLLPSQNDTGNYTKVTQVIPIKIAVSGTGDAHLMIGMNAGVRIHVM